MPLDGLVFYQIDGVTRLRRKQVVELDATSWVIIEASSKLLKLEFFDCPINRKVYEIEPEDEMVTVGSSEECNISLDFLKSHLEFVIEYNGSDGWDISSTNSI